MFGQYIENTKDGYVVILGEESILVDLENPLHALLLAAAEEMANTQSNLLDCVKSVQKEAEYAVRDAENGMQVNSFGIFQNSALQANRAAALYQKAGENFRRTFLISKKAESN